MFARVKKSGKNQYLQIVESRREGKKVKQKVIATLGRLEDMQGKGEIEALIRSLSRFSEKALLVLSGKSDINASAKKIGPVLIFERIWRDLGIGDIIKGLLADRKFEFDVERALFLTTLHRLMVSGSDRSCDKWHRDYAINGVDDLALHHLYRAMNFLGETLADQDDATPFAPRCTKDLVEEKLFHRRRDLFTELDLVFFDTTSIYFEGSGGTTLGKKGHSKDHRPDLNQMVVGAVIDEKGNPVCCEMWPGNTADVKTLIPIADRLRNRFNISRFCLVADRGMISQETMAALEERNTPYILGARMKLVKEIKEEVLSRAGRYQEVYPERGTKDPSPLKVKEVKINGQRYIVCFNTKQARKDAIDRQVIVEKLRKKLKEDPKSLIGNKGYRKYLTVGKGQITINQKKLENEARFDGKWVLKTNTNLPAREVALKYKELWQVEHLFRDVKSALDTRPVFHQCDENIKGHVFCSFLALVLKKELDRRLDLAGHDFEWADVKQDLKALQAVTITENEKSFTIRSECQGCSGKVFQAVGVAIPPTIREV